MKYSARLIVFGIIFFTLTLCGNPAFPYTAPDPAKTFYGDATGDQQLQSDDLPMHKLQVYLGVPAYNTPQLNNVDDRWNTCDVTGDFRCQTDDMTPLKAAVNLTPLPKNWDSWEIVNVSLPTTANVGEAKAFQISPRAVSAAIANARPGINVKLTVAPDSPVQNVTLGGRACPVVDPKCAVSVGITAWQTSTTLAPTETGTAEFSFAASEAGVLTLVAEFAAQPAMKIAAASARFSVNIIPNGVWFVNDNATGANNGTSWADAFTTVQAGMDAASSGEQVWVAEGTYMNFLEMKDSVDMYGGFAGTELILSERGNPAEHPTILDGANASTVVWAATNARLDGFTITHGYSPHGAAGLIIIEQTNFIVANCKFTENIASTYGGGIYCDNFIYGENTNKISNCTFEGNKADYGGAVYIFGFSPSISDCTFFNNTSNIDGGAMFIEYTTLILTNCVFQENKSTLYGGAIENAGALLSIVNCLFINNKSSQGGGIVSWGGVDEIINCTFNNNMASNRGGALYFNNSTPQIKNCILWGDMAPIDAEIYSSSSSNPIVSYSDIEGGYSGTGNIDADPLFINVPNFGDSTIADGLTNTIEVAFATDYALNDVIEIENDGIARTVSDISGTTVKFSQARSYITTANMLIANWGFGATDLVEDYHLGVGSPAINAGDPDSHFNDPDASRNDMGAYGAWVVYA